MPAPFFDPAFFDPAYFIPHYAPITLATLQADLFAQTDFSPFWTPEQARLALNEGLRVYNLLTGAWKQRIVAPTVAGQVWYHLPGTLVYRLRIELDNRPLDPASTFELDQIHPNWESETTASGGGVPASVQCWIPKGLSWLGLWPADAVGGKSLGIDGIRQTPTLLLPADTLDLNASEHDALIDYAVHALSFAGGAELLRRTWPRYRAFLQACATQNSRLLASQFFRQILGYDQGRRLKPSMVGRKPSSVVQQVLQTLGTTSRTPQQAATPAADPTV